MMNMSSGKIGDSLCFTEEVKQLEKEPYNCCSSGSEGEMWERYERKRQEVKKIVCEARKANEMWWEEYLEPLSYFVRKCVKSKKTVIRGGIRYKWSGIRR